MKVLNMFKKWFLNLLDSIAKTFKSTDFLTKLFFCIPTLLIIASVPWHANVASLCTTTGSSGIPYYYGAVFMFLAMLFSIVIAYVGMGYVGKRKVSSFVLLMVFVVIYLLFTILFMVVTSTDQGIKLLLETADKAADTKATLAKSYILQCIAIVSTIVGSVLAATKIDPTYYKERNN